MIHPLFGILFYIIAHNSAEISSIAKTDGKIV